MAQGAGTSRVQRGAAAQVLVAAAVTAVVVAAGALLPPVSRWALAELSGREWPRPWPLLVVAEIGAGWAVPLFAAVGLVLGCVVAGVARREALALDVGSEHLGWTQGDDAGLVARERSTAVFLDGAELVALDGNGRELLRRRASDLDGRHVSAALVARGWPWTGSDPRPGCFSRWFDGHPDLAAEQHALLRRRCSALEAREPARAHELREQLQDDGIAVRDRAGHQQVRRLVRLGGVRGQDR